MSSDNTQTTSTNEGQGNKKYIYYGGAALIILIILILSIICIGYYRRKVRILKQKLYDETHKRTNILSSNNSLEETIQYTSFNNSQIKSNTNNNNNTIINYDEENYTDVSKSKNEFFGENYSNYTENRLRKGEMSELDGEDEINSKMLNDDSYKYQSLYSLNTIQSINSIKPSYSYYSCINNAENANLQKSFSLYHHSPNVSMLYEDPNNSNDRPDSPTTHQNYNSVLRMIDEVSKNNLNPSPSSNSTSLSKGKLDEKITHKNNSSSQNLINLNINNNSSNNNNKNTIKTLRRNNRGFFQFEFLPISEQNQNSKDIIPLPLQKQQSPSSHQQKTYISSNDTSSPTTKSMIISTAELRGTSTPNLSSPTSTPTTPITPSTINTSNTEKSDVVLLNDRKEKSKKEHRQSYTETLIPILSEKRLSLLEKPTPVYSEKRQSMTERHQSINTNEKRQSINNGSSEKRHSKSEKRQSFTETLTAILSEKRHSKSEKRQSYTETLTPILSEKRHSKSEKRQSYTETLTPILSEKRHSKNEKRQSYTETLTPILSEKRQSVSEKRQSYTEKLTPLLSDKCHSLLMDKRHSMTDKISIGSLNDHKRSSYLDKSSRHQSVQSIHSVHNVVDDELISPRPISLLSEKRISWIAADMEGKFELKPPESPSKKETSPKYSESKAHKGSKTSLTLKSSKSSNSLENRIEDSPENSCDSNNRPESKNRNDQRYNSNNTTPNNVENNGNNLNDNNNNTSTNNNINNGKSGNNRVSVTTNRSSKVSNTERSSRYYSKQRLSLLSNFSENIDHSGNKVSPSSPSTKDNIGKNKSNSPTSPGKYSDKEKKLHQNSTLNTTTTFVSVDDNDSDNDYEKSRIFDYDKNTYFKEKGNTNNENASAYQNNNHENGWQRKENNAKNYYRQDLGYGNTSLLKQENDDTIINVHRNDHQDNGYLNNSNNKNRENNSLMDNDHEFEGNDSMMDSTNELQENNDISSHNNEYDEKIDDSEYQEEKRVNNKKSGKINHCLSIDFLNNRPNNNAYSTSSISTMKSFSATTDSNGNDTGNDNSSSTNSHNNKLYKEYYDKKTTNTNSSYSSNINNNNIYENSPESKMALPKSSLSMNNDHEIFSEQDLEIIRKLSPKNTNKGYSFYGLYNEVRPAKSSQRKVLSSSSSSGYGYNNNNNRLLKDKMVYEENSEIENNVKGTTTSSSPLTISASTTPPLSINQINSKILTVYDSDSTTTDRTSREYKNIFINNANNLNFDTSTQAKSYRDYDKKYSNKEKLALESLRENTISRNSSNASTPTKSTILSSIYSNQNSNYGGASSSQQQQNENNFKFFNNSLNSSFNLNNDIGDNNEVDDIDEDDDHSNSNYFSLDNIDIQNQFMFNQEISKSFDDLKDIKILDRRSLYSINPPKIPPKSERRQRISTSHSVVTKDKKEENDLYSNSSINIPKYTQSMILEKQQQKSQHSQNSSIHSYAASCTSQSQTSLQSANTTMNYNTSITSTTNVNSLSSRISPPIKVSSSIHQSLTSYVNSNSNPPTESNLNQFTSSSNSSKQNLANVSVYTATTTSPTMTSKPFNQNTLNNNNNEIPNQNLNILDSENNIVQPGTSKTTTITSDQFCSSSFKSSTSVVSYTSSNYSSSDVREGNQSNDGEKLPQRIKDSVPRRSQYSNPKESSRSKSSSRKRKNNSSSSGQNKSSTSHHHHHYSQQQTTPPPSQVNNFSVSNSSGLIPQKEKSNGSDNKKTIDKDRLLNKVDDKRTINEYLMATPTRKNDSDTTSNSLLNVTTFESSTLYSQPFEFSETNTNGPPSSLLFSNSSSVSSLKNNDSTKEKASSTSFGIDKSYEMDLIKRNGGSSNSQLTITNNLKAPMFDHNKLYQNKINNKDNNPNKEINLNINTQNISNIQAQGNNFDNNRKITTPDSLDSARTLNTSQAINNTKHNQQFNTPITTLTTPVNDLFEGTSQKKIQNQDFDTSKNIKCIINKEELFKDNNNNFVDEQATQTNSYSKDDENDDEDYKKYVSNRQNENMQLFNSSTKMYNDKKDKVKLSTSLPSNMSAIQSSLYYDDIEKDDGNNEDSSFSESLDTMKNNKNIRKHYSLSSNNNNDHNNNYNNEKTLPLLRDIISNSLLQLQSKKLKPIKGKVHILVDPSSSTSSSESSSPNNSPLLLVDDEQQQQLSKDNDDSIDTVTIKNVSLNSKNTVINDNNNTNNNDSIEISSTASSSEIVSNPSNLDNNFIYPKDGVIFVDPMSVNKSIKEKDIQYISDNNDEDKSNEDIKNLKTIQNIKLENSSLISLTDSETNNNNIESTKSAKVEYGPMKDDKNDDLSNNDNKDRVNQIQQNKNNMSVLPLANTTSTSSSLIANSTISPTSPSYKKMNNKSRLLSYNHKPELYQMKMSPHLPLTTKRIPSPSPSLLSSRTGKSMKVLPSTSNNSLRSSAFISKSPSPQQQYVSYYNQQSLLHLSNSNNNNRRNSSEIKNYILVEEVVNTDGNSASTTNKGNSSNNGSSSSSNGNAVACSYSQEENALDVNMDYFGTDTSRTSDSTTITEYKNIPNTDQSISVAYNKSSLSTSSDDDFDDEEIISLDINLMSQDDASTYNSPLLFPVVMPPNYEQLIKDPSYQL